MRRVVKRGISCLLLFGLSLPIYTQQPTPKKDLQKVAKPTSPLQKVSLAAGSLSLLVYLLYKKYLQVSFPIKQSLPPTQHSQDLIPTPPNLLGQTKLLPCDPKSTTAEPIVLSDTEKPSSPRQDLTPSNLSNATELSSDTEQSDLFNALYAAAENFYGTELTDNCSIPIDWKYGRCISEEKDNKTAVRNFIENAIKTKKIPASDNPLLQGLVHDSNFIALCRTENIHIAEEDVKSGRWHNVKEYFKRRVFKRKITPSAKNQGEDTFDKANTDLELEISALNDVKFIETNILKNVLNILNNDEPLSELVSLLQQHQNLKSPLIQALCAELLANNEQEKKEYFIRSVLYLIKQNNFDIDDIETLLQIIRHSHEKILWRMNNNLKIITYRLAHETEPAQKKELESQLQKIKQGCCKLTIELTALDNFLKRVNSYFPSNNQLHTYSIPNNELVLLIEKNAERFAHLMREYSANENSIAELKKFNEESASKKQLALYESIKKGLDTKIKKQKRVLYLLLYLAYSA